MNPGADNSQAGERMQPVVLVACNRVEVIRAGQTVPFDGVHRAYVDALLDADLVPVLVPIGMEAEVQRLLEVASGVLLTGGPDVDPDFYGQPRHPTTYTHLDLDHLEMAVAKGAIAIDLPVLAVCRGIQVLNVALGGTLVQDIKSQRQGAIDHQPGGPRNTLAHVLSVNRPSRLADAIGSSEITVNSIHHQAIDKLADGLQSVAWTSDGVVEAVELVNRTWVVGVQFHPEELRTTVPQIDGLFKAFGCAARRRQEQTASRS